MQVYFDLGAAHNEILWNLGEYGHYVLNLTKPFSVHKPLAKQFGLKSKSDFYTWEGEGYPSSGMVGYQFELRPSDSKRSGRGNVSAVEIALVIDQTYPISEGERLPINEDTISLTDALISRLDPEDIEDILDRHNYLERHPYLSKDFMIVHYPHDSKDGDWVWGWTPYFLSDGSSPEDRKRKARMHFRKLLREVEELLKRGHPELYSWVNTYFLLSYGLWLLEDKGRPHLYVVDAWLSEDLLDMSPLKGRSSDHYWAYLNVFPSSFPRWPWIFYLEFDPPEGRDGRPVYTLASHGRECNLAVRRISHPVLFLEFRMWMSV